MVPPFGFGFGFGFCFGFGFELRRYGPKSESAVVFAVVYEGILQVESCCESTLTPQISTPETNLSFYFHYYLKIQFISSLPEAKIT